MATRAEWFRYFAERSGPKLPPRQAREKAQERGGVRIARKATYALEDSAGRPSRKTTRKASNRSRTDAQMRWKRKTAEVRPESRPRPTR
jgi:hypothetical protein